MKGEEGMNKVIKFFKNNRGAFIMGAFLTLFLIIFGVLGGFEYSDQKVEAEAAAAHFSRAEMASYSASIAEHEEEVALQNKAARNDADELRERLARLNEEADAEQVRQSEAVKKAVFDSEIQENCESYEKIQINYEKGQKNTENAQNPTLNVQNPTKKYELTETEEALLKRIAMAEAEGESTECKACIMLVVLNRVQSDSFPDTVDGVLTAAGQFDPVETGGIWCKEPSEGCVEALDLIQSGWDESQGATYFKATALGYSWHDSALTTLFSMDNTTFYKE